MTGPLYARASAQATARLSGRHVAAAAAALFLVLAPIGALANPDNNNSNDNNRDEQRDTQSRHEQKSLNSISLVTEDSRLAVRAIIIIQPRIVEVSQTSFGVDFESLDRVDVSNVPLFGSLFGRPLQAGDLTADNRVGTVYRAGETSIAAVIDGGVDISEVTLSVVNGKGRFEVSQQPRIVDVAPSDLGELGTLPTLKTVMAGTASRETTIVLGGLTSTTVPETEGKVPVLSDVPMLQRLFLGTVHRREDNNLIMFIRPSIIAGDEDF